VAKAKLVAKGFQDDRKDLDTYSGTANWWSLLLILSFASTHQWNRTKSDVRTAFLTAEMNDEVFVQLPAEMLEGAPDGLKAGEVLSLSRAMYGLADAPRLYTRHFKRIAKEEGWEEVIESIFVKEGKGGEIEGVMIMHVDDLLIFSSDPMSLFSPLQSRLKMDEPELLEERGKMTYIGMALSRIKEGCERLS